MVVPLCFFVAAWTYALCVNFVPSYRIPVDSLGAAKIGVENVGASDEENSPERKEGFAENEKAGVQTSEDAHHSELAKEVK